jgi:hypothetical protein
MAEMVERVARALCTLKCLHIGGPDAETQVPGKKNWTFHVREACAAVEAMREPTARMVSEGESVASFGIGKPTDEQAIPNVWRAMIETALTASAAPHTAPLGSQCTESTPPGRG